MLEFVSNRVQIFLTLFLLGVMMMGCNSNNKSDILGIHFGEKYDTQSAAVILKQNTNIDFVKDLDSYYDLFILSGSNVLFASERWDKVEYHFNENGFLSYVKFYSYANSRDLSEGFFNYLQNRLEEKYGKPSNKSNDVFKFTSWKTSNGIEIKIFLESLPRYAVRLTYSDTKIPSNL